MMNKDKLKGILSDPPDDTDDEDGLEYGSDDADADAILAAIKSADPTALADALRAFVESCSAYAPDEAETEE